MNPEWESASVDKPPGSAPADFKAARMEKALLADPTKVDRLPPHSIEAEQGTLGCALLAPLECLPDLVEKLKAGGEEFYDLRHKSIYSVLVEMWDKKLPIDLITIQQRLKDKNMLEGVGGLSYLASLPDCVPSAANMMYYVVILKEKYVLRRMVATCTGIVGKAYEYQGEVDKLLDECDADFKQTIDYAQAVAAEKTIKDFVVGAMDNIDRIHVSKDGIIGLTTGIADLDKATGGLLPATLIYLAARPSVGKSSLAMNIVEHLAVDQKIPVGVFSLEMTGESLIQRMIASRARVAIRKMKDSDIPKTVSAASQIKNSPIYIDETPGINVLRLKAKARRWHQDHGIKLLVVDYIQLVTTSDRNAGNREQEVANISKGFQSLSRELKIPVLVLAQLNRQVEGRQSNKPRSSDLRESGGLEQDADLVWLLWRVKEGEDDKSNPTTAVNLTLGKQRNDEIQDIQLVFFKGWTRFQMATKPNDNGPSKQ